MGRKIKTIRLQLPQVNTEGCGLCRCHLASRNQNDARYLKKSTKAESDFVLLLAPGIGL